jgi:uridine phosphorylase
MISETELILTRKGRIYHLDLAPDEIPDTIITVGDPGRVKQVSNYFDRILLKRVHREFVSHLGELGSEKLMVISTGIGTDNIDIVINEIDALVNIDFKTRLVKKEKKSLRIIRIGTSGTIRPDIEIDSLLISKYASYLILLICEN